MKHHTLHLILCATLLALLLTACTPQFSRTPAPTLVAATPTVLLPATPLPASRSNTEAEPLPGSVEEIAFESGEFTLVGDLRTPAGTGPFPVVLFVHGSGPIDRTMFGYYLPIMERMLQAGYAVFSWDKPDYGESTGQLSNTRVYHQRAQIVLDAIEVMKARSDIDHRRIGLWGISQASYVMPLVLSQSDDVAFMICVSCGGMSGHDEATYQITSFAMFCADVPEENTDQRTALLAELDKARSIETYEEYLHYREVLDAFVDISPYRQKLLDALSQNGASGVIPEEAWLENDPEIEGCGIRLVCSSRFGSRSWPSLVTGTRMAIRSRGRTPGGKPWSRLATGTFAWNSTQALITSWSRRSPAALMSKRKRSIRCCKNRGTDHWKNR